MPYRYSRTRAESKQNVLHHAKKGPWRLFIACAAVDIAAGRECPEDTAVERWA